MYTHKTGSWFFLRVLFKIFDEHLVLLCGSALPPTGEGGRGNVLAENDYDLHENEPVVETQYDWFHKLVLMKREKIKEMDYWLNFSKKFKAKSDKKSSNLSF